MVEIVDKTVGIAKSNGQNLVKMFVPLVVGSVVIFVVSKFIKRG